MGRLIYSINVTLDGRCDHEQVVADDEHHRVVLEQLRAADAVLLGRATHDGFAAHWPELARSGDGPPDAVAFARLLEAKPRYVATRRASPSTWATVLRDVAVDVPRLKDGGDVLVFGSPGLGRALLDARLVDELAVFVQPILAGGGRPFLDGLAAPIDLRHVGSRTLASGVVVATYAPR